jgi:hypothetical protein
MSDLIINLSKKISKYSFLDMARYSIPFGVIIFLWLANWRTEYDISFSFVFLYSFIAYAVGYLLLFIIKIPSIMFDREVEINKATKNVGLRYEYNKNKRLPMFICEHCLKTIIVKDMTCQCAYCNTLFLVDRSKDVKIIGDTAISGTADFSTESTLEKFLFDKCPICKEITQSLICYHCGKEIELLEHYDENKLKSKRHE